MKRRLLLAALLSFSIPAPAQETPEPKVEPPKLKLRLVLSDWEPIRDRDTREAELLFAALAADWKHSGWGAKVELRGREGLFRPYFPSSVWLEEGFAFVETAVGQVRAGKLPRTFGVEDVTFAGNLFSRNGVSRNPDFGAALCGSRRIGHDTLTWSASYFGRNDHVAWEADGIGVESDPDAKLRDAFGGRVTYKWNNVLWSITPGLSLESGRIVRTEDQLRRTDWALDLTGTLGPLSLTAMLFRRGGQAPGARLGYGDSSAGLVEVQIEFPNTLYRYTYSEWSYGGGATSERAHQVGIAWNGIRGIEGTVEYNARRLRTITEISVVNAFQLGVALRF